MCEITEDLFFNDPYQVHERNNYPAELELMLPPCVTTRRSGWQSRR
jgi:5-methylthioribose kinase